MNKPDADLLQGTLDLMILKTVALGPIHGYGIYRCFSLPAHFFEGKPLNGKWMRK